MENENSWYWIRIFFGDYSRGPKGSLSTEVLALAKEMNLAGATVLKGLNGYSLVGSPGSNQLFGGQEKSIPLIIEIPIGGSKIDDFMERLSDLVKGGSSNVMIAKIKSEVIVSDPDLLRT